MRDIVYKCLNEKCNAIFHEVNKDGICCPVCGEQIIPINEFKDYYSKDIPTYKYLKKVEKQTGIINTEWLATEVAGIIFNQGKAKIFNVLESQIDDNTQPFGDSPRLRATKRITEDIIAGISKNAADLIRDTLGDWQEEVEVGPEVELTDDERQDIEQDYKQIESIIK